MGSFIVCVPGTLSLTLVGKIRLVKMALGHSTSGAGAIRSDRAAEMRTTYERFRLGLATAADSRELADYLEDLKLNTDH